MRSIHGRILAIAYIASIFLCTPLVFAQNPQEFAPRKELLSKPFQNETDLIFLQTKQLEQRQLIEAVLKRNPSLETARLAWQVAIAKYPQAIALEDPTLSYTIAPLSIPAQNVRFGQIIQLRQQIPFPGKRKLSGMIAKAEARVLEENHETARVKLALMASLLFYEYYRVERSLEVNQHHSLALYEIKKSAEAQFVVSRASLQDPIQAEVEIALLEQKVASLLEEKEIIIAQLNSLLHRAPSSFIPPPPSTLSAPTAFLPETGSLQKELLDTNPELNAIDAQIQSGHSSVALAKREFFPDFSILGIYSSMEGVVEHQVMLGVSITLPVQRKSRNANLEEALARRAYSESQQDVLRNRIYLEIETAVATIRKSQKIKELYQNRLLPAASDQIQAARSGFEAGQNSFRALIDAEKNLYTIKLKYQIVITDIYQAMAHLDYALGRIPGTLEKVVTP